MLGGVVWALTVGLFALTVSLESPSVATAYVILWTGLGIGALLGVIGVIGLAVRSGTRG